MNTCQTAQGADLSVVFGKESDGDQRLKCVVSLQAG